MATARRYVDRHWLKERFGFSRTTIYRLMDTQGFPKPVKLGPGQNSWIEAEVTAWEEARIALRDQRAA